MATKKAKKKKPQSTVLVEFHRHLPGPPRRAPGQRIWVYRSELAALKDGDDYAIVKTNSPASGGGGGSK